MNVACLLFHEVHELDAVGPYSAIFTAKRWLDDPDSLNVYTVAKSRNSVQTSGALTITPHWAFASAPAPDVLIVPGGAGVTAAGRDKALTSYLQDARPHLRLLVSVCTGALLLGELGLLRDLKATTWAGKRDTLRDYEVGEIIDARLVKNDNGIWCAGGVTAGIDAGLEVVAELYGRAVAANAAEHINYPYWQAEAEVIHP